MQPAEADVAEAVAAAVAEAAAVAATVPLSSTINMDMKLGRDVHLIQGCLRGAGGFGTVLEGIDSQVGKGVHTYYYT